MVSSEIKTPWLAYNCQLIAHSRTIGHSPDGCQRLLLLLPLAGQTLHLRSVDCFHALTGYLGNLDKYCTASSSDSPTSWVLPVFSTVGWHTQAFLLQTRMIMGVTNEPACLAGAGPAISARVVLLLIVLMFYFFNSEYMV